MEIKRPAFLIGNGIRGNPKLIEYICSLKIPVMTTWQACDLIPEDSPVFCGRPGTVGQRGANVCQQKSDWLMIIGARLDNEQIGHNMPGFAPRAHKIVVDIDVAELNKYPLDWEKMQADLSDPDFSIPHVADNPTWLSECKNLYAKYRFELDGTDSGNVVDPYSFIRELSNACCEGDVLVPGSSGMQSCAFLQAFKIKQGQRILVCNTIGSMGMEPMAIGAAIASKKRVIVITGDGGFAQNVQELEVVKRLNLPIHYFIFENGGYGSISTMQDGRFGLRVGCTPESGFTIPTLEWVADVWGLWFYKIENNSQLDTIKRVVALPFPTLTSVKTSLEFRYACKIASNMVDGKLVPDPMEDLSPHLPPDELAELMR